MPSQKLPLIRVERDGQSVLVDSRQIDRYLDDGWVQVAQEEPIVVRTDGEGGTSTPPEEPQDPPQDPVADSGITIADSVIEAIEAAGYTTAQSILNATDEELLAIKGVGEKTLEDLRTVAQLRMDAAEAASGGGQEG